ncbi:glyQS [Symbiodinium sp. KB8]|nr:glyQS [Symbiodinium sp. KB8]
MAGNWQAARRGARLAAGFQFRRALSTPAAAAVHEDIVSFSRRRGFVFPGSDIYGSIGVGYDYGPLGASLKKNLIDQWWSQFITKRSEVHGLDTSIILNPAVWKASGHVDNFTDPLSECRSCHHRAR